jgi:GH43 family beta-xylosidase
LPLALLAAILSVLLNLAHPAGAAQDDQAGQRLPTRGPVKDASGVAVPERLNLVDGLLRGMPIIDGDFADPYALSERDAIYVYATNTVDANIPVVELPKDDALTGKYLGDAMPDLPSWTSKGFQWGPAVWARPDGRFVLYYATPSSKGSPRMCISRALGSSPAGPFKDDSSGPFICPLSQGGAIDPSVFVDGGVPYLVWKSDGNCCNLPTDIYSQRLSSDGMSVDGEPVKLIDSTQKWQAGIVEGPAMIRQGETYYLFYSANDWNTVDYAIGVATCESVNGPCKETTDSAWMGSEKLSLGPGGQEFVEAPTGGLWMVHHGWLPDQAGTADGQRRLYLDRISLHSGDELPTRSDTEAVEEALFEDAAFLALLVGLAIGGVVVLGAVWRHRRSARNEAGQDISGPDPS